MAEGTLDRESKSSGRGRPTHRYRLTSAGRRRAGANFVDLAMALWEEVRSIKDADVKRALLQRLATRLADFYRSSIRGETLDEKMEAVAALFGERQIPLAVEAGASGPELNVLACPYPDLAEQDRGICSMERMMFADLLGESTRLSHCRLDGDDCCTFQPRDIALPEGTEQVVD